MHWIIEPILYILILSPILFFAKKTKDWNNNYLWLFIFYAIADNLVTSLPLQVEMLDFINLKMNWSGKIYSYLLALLFLLTTNKLSLKEVGLTFSQKENSIRFSIITAVILSLLMIAYSVISGGYTSGLENILFQLTMPSIVEEIVMRGILLALLNKIFFRNLKLGKTNFGWGLIITSVLFGLWHGVGLSNEFSIQFNAFPLIYTAIIGFTLGLVRERSGSLLVPILLHILINLIPNISGYFL